MLQKCHKYLKKCEITLHKVKLKLYKLCNKVKLLLDKKVVKLLPFRAVFESKVYPYRRKNTLEDRA